MSDNSKIHVGVYGTLKRGYGNHRLLKNCSVYLGEWLLSGNYSMVDLGAFPGVIDSEGQSTILTEVYSLDGPTVLQNLDRLEGHPSFYCRREVLVRNQSGDSKSVWLYFLPSDRYSSYDEVPQNQGGITSWEGRKIYGGE